MLTLNGRVVSTLCSFVPEEKRGKSKFIRKAYIHATYENNTDEPSNCLDRRDVFQCDRCGRDIRAVGIDDLRRFTRLDDAGPL